MTHFADLRAIARHGEDYLCAKATIALSLVVAEPDGRQDPETIALVVRGAGGLPGLSSFDDRILRAAALSVLDHIAAEGGARVQADAIARLKDQRAIEALLLATQVYRACAPETDDLTSALVPLAQALNIESRRHQAIAVMARKRPIEKELAH